MGQRDGRGKGKENDWSLEGEDMWLKNEDT